MCTKIKKQIIDCSFVKKEQVITGLVADLLTKNQLTIGTAESCTGGMLAGKLTALPGSSVYFLGSIIAYANRVKIKVLGIPQELLKKCGAVSKEVGTAMAAAIQTQLGCDIGIGITGIAGPGGGTNKKPVGLVYIALTTPTKTICKGYYFQGDRELIRRKAVFQAQSLLWRYLNKYTNEDSKT